MALKIPVSPNPGFPKGAGRGAAVACIALCAGLFVPGAAQAQFYFDTWGGTFRERWDYAPRMRPYAEGAPLPRAEVRAIVRQLGYRIEAPIMLNRDVYVVPAIDRAGRRVRLIVDAFDGTVMRPVATSPQPGERMGRPYFEDERPLPGPKVIPGIGPAPRPAQKPKEAQTPQKPVTARAEPKAAPQKPPLQAAPAAPLPAPAPPLTSAQGEPAKTEAPKPEQRSETRAQAITESSPGQPASPEPRVIQLYTSPADSAAAPPEKQIDDAH